MAITTYSELQTNISDFLNRDDLSATVLGTFVSLAESQINRDIRHYEMIGTATDTVSTKYLTKPTNWLETIKLQLTGDGTSVLKLVSVAHMDDARESNDDASGIPMKYAHTGTSFELYPTPSGSFDTELLYYQKIPALTDVNTTNWLLDEAPDVYLYGSLLHTSGYLGEDARIATWAQLYSAAVQRLNETSDSAQWSGTGLTMRNKGLR